MTALAVRDLVEEGHVHPRHRTLLSGPLRRGI